MKRIVGIVFLIMSISMFGARINKFNISKSEVIHMVYDTTKVVFSKYHDEWNDILLGTLAAETDLGAYKGNSKHGVAQITPIAYKFIKKEILKDKKTYEKLKSVGLDFKKISFNDLTNNHKASVTAMALYYKYTVEKKKVNIHGKDKAEVWKKYYNTYAGSGTKEHFNKAYSRNKSIINETMLACKSDDVKDVKLAKASLIENDIYSTCEVCEPAEGTMTVASTDDFTTFTTTISFEKEESDDEFAYNKLLRKFITVKNIAQSA